MIEALVGFAVAQRKWVVAIWLLVALGFLAVAIRLRLDALPDITSNQVQIFTKAEGLTPEEVELRVTRPLEASLGGLAGLSESRSLSRYGLSAITLVFEDEVDLMRARQLAAERLVGAASSLPRGVSTPELGPITGGLGEVFHFTVSAPTRTPAELLELVEFRVAPILKSVPGIVEVNTWGGAERTLDVHADPNRMVARGISFEELRHALTLAIGSEPGAALPNGDRQVLLRGILRPTNARELADGLVKLEQGVAIRIGDVATIQEGTAPRLGAATKNGQGETVYVMAQMLIGANARDVTHAARAKMADVREALPRDVVVEMVYDRSKLVDTTLRTVAKSLAEGGLLVALVLFLMLGSGRAGVVVAITIPVAMLGATAAMTVLGVSGNLMSLGAVDFGLLVDGAVVLIEHVFHTENSDEKLPWPERVEKACRAVARPSFFGVFVILLVYVPVLSLSGVDGKMFRPMAITVVLALLVTLVFTLTFIPAAAALFLREKDIPLRTPVLVRAVEWLHGHGLALVTPRPLIVLGISLVTLVLAVHTATRLGAELAPTLDEGSLVIQTTRAADLSIEGAVIEASKMERAIKRDTPEVESIVSRLGSPAVATDTMGLEQADVFVQLAPKSRWRVGMTKAKLLALLSARIEEATPDSQAAFTQPIQMRFNELLGGAPYDVVVSVLGQELGPLHTMAGRVLTVVASVAGVQDARILAEDEIPLTDIRPNSLSAATRGLSGAQVLDLVRALRLGVNVGSTYDGPKEIPITLRLGPEAPHALGIRGLLVPGPLHELVPLTALAEVREHTAPAAIYRINGERRVLLGFNVRGRELGDVVRDATQQVDARVANEEGTRVAWGGQFETLQAARKRLSLVIPVVLVLVALVLFIHFRKVSPVLWVLSHVPFAALGGVFALLARSMALSVSAGIGFIALWGIAVMNGTVLVTEIGVLEAQGHTPVDATLLAVKSRARPVTMTALVAALGFLPMALAQGVGSEVQRPLATVVIGGLLTSTFLTLLVLPTLRIAFVKRFPSTRSTAALSDPRDRS